MQKLCFRLCASKSKQTSRVSPGSWLSFQEHVYVVIHVKSIPECNAVLVK